MDRERDKEGGRIAGCPIRAEDRIKKMVEGQKGRKKERKNERKNERKKERQ